jgi:hypothetical protein
MMLRSIAALLFSIVLIAGCVGQAPSTTMKVSPDDGLQSVQFEAEPSSVDVGDSVIFTLAVQNVGGTDATNVIARLLGIEGQWRYLNGSLVGSTSKNLGNLKPPNTLYNQPGDMKSVTWTYKTPTIPPGLNVDTTVQSEVLYSYNTTGSLTYRVIGDRFLKMEYFPKNKVPQGPVIFNTNAPVKILIPTAHSGYYIRIEDSSEDPTAQQKPIQFELVNVGSGFPISGGIAGAIFGTISLRGPGNPTFQDCLGQSGTSKVTIEPGTIGADISKLRTSKGKVTISCAISLNRDAFVLQDEQISLDFNLGYRYYLQTPLTVKVSSVQ